jgi:hypothetical protein
VQFYDLKHCVDPQSSFVKHEFYSNAYAERIFYPSENCKPLYPTLLPLLNNLTKQAFGENNGLGECYIAKQLEMSKELILIRNTSSYTIDYYLRLDVYSHLPVMPCGLGMFKVPKSNLSGIITNLTLRVLFDELKYRRSNSLYNPELLLMLRTDNPKIYEMRKKISKNIYPNLEKIKKASDHFFRNLLMNLLDKNEDEAVNFLIDNNFIESNNKKADKNSLKNSLVKILPSISLNINALKLASDSMHSHYIQEVIRNEIKSIYRASVPEEYAGIMKEIMQNSFGINVLHDYDIFRVHDATPNAKINNFKEQAHSSYINDFFNLFLSEERRDILIFCSEIDYHLVSKKLLDSSK